LPVVGLQFYFSLENIKQKIFNPDILRIRAIDCWFARLEQFAFRIFFFEEQKYFIYHSFHPTMPNLHQDRAMLTHFDILHSYLLMFD